MLKNISDPPAGCSTVQLRLQLSPVNTASNSSEKSSKDPFYHLSLIGEKNSSSSPQWTMRQSIPCRLIPSAALLPAETAPIPTVNYRYMRCLLLRKF
jgi:hypothetical protein